jgi:hypothetical protein
MAEKKITETTKDYVPTADDVVYSDGRRTRIGANKKVSVEIPKEVGVNHQIPVYVNRNNETSLIERGKTVLVKASTAEVIEEAKRLRNVFEEHYAKVSS